jgi:predicted adenine nucleotide alpha hydrolase (AANH) superfamily ATPase
MSEKYGVGYLFSDFKKKNGYKRSIELSEQYSLYRQDYCGCVFSKRDAEKRRQEKPQDQFNNKTNHQL